MERKRKENVMDLLKRTEDLDGIKISGLESDTKLIVETQNSIYEFVLGEQVMVTGGKMADGSVRFSEPVHVKINGSTYGGTMIRMDWIGQDMHLEFVVMNEPKYMITTSSIKNVILKAIDGDWYYSMDWNTKNTT